MSKMNEHPTVRAVRLRSSAERTGQLDAAELRRICLDAGADDVGFVSVDRPELAAEVEDIRRVFAPTRTLICLLCRMNPDPTRSPARSVANMEFHATGDRVNDVARAIVTALLRLGVRAVNPAMAFPMEME